MPRDVQDRVAPVAAPADDADKLHQLEVSLRERERQLREAQRIACLGTWRWDRATDSTTWSEEVYRAFGLDPAGPAPGYDVIRDMHSPASRQNLEAAVQRALATGEPYEHDVELHLPDGSTHWIIARGEVESFRDGVPAVLRGTIQDITGRKLAELALQQRERDHREAQRIGRMGSWHWVLDTNHLTWSEEVYSLLEHDPSLPVLMFSDHPQMFEGDSLQQLQSAIDRAIATGEPYAVDAWMRLPSGKRVCFTTRGEPVFDTHGKVIELRGTVRDITDRKLIEDEVQQSEARYRSVLDSITDGLAVLDKNWNYTYFSEQGARILNLRVEDMIGRNFWELFPFAQETTFGRAYRQAVNTGKPVHFEDFYPEPLNKWVECHCYPSAEGLSVYFRDVTEQRLAEAAVRDSQTRFQRLYESDLLGIGFPNSEGAILDCNDALLRTIGYTREDLDAGLVRWDLMTPPEYRELDLIHIRQSAERGSCTPYRKEYIRKDGSRVPIMVGFARLGGDKAGSIGFVLDLSAQQQAEHAFRETRSRFEKLYDANLLGICYPDKFGAFYDGNDEFLRIVGYSRQELDAGLVRWDNMTPPEFAQRDADHIAEAARNGSCRPYEKEYIRKDGTRVPILCGYALLEGSDANYIGFILDLTQQKHAENAIREREQRFSALAESLPQLVWASAPNGDRIYVNSRYSEYTGMTAEDLVGAHWRHFLHPDDLPRTNELWYASMASGEDYSNEYRIRRHDGMYRSFLARAVAVRNPDGTIERWLGSATDIHDQKLAEEALRRTEKLAATGRLAASIAHEINNPLESVTNALYLALMDTSLHQDTRTYLKMAEQELARVAQVTTQTLRFHRQSVAPAQVDVTEIMDSAFSLFAQRFEASAISVDHDYTPGQLLYCRADELRQVFANFLSNALDATRQGGRVRIRIHPSMDCGPAACPGIRVTIADTGSGIPAHLRKSIFEPFISTKEATGTGLGLWVSDGIVQKHKGRITLRSRTDAPHHGTVFSLFFPLDGIQTS